MAKVHPGASITPHFREFLPPWVARQPWYAGTGTPVLSPVGYFRFEDPAGEVGIETHLVADGPVLYQIPMTYRGRPCEEVRRASGDPLIATAEHSVLGTRWIYDGVADPAWRGELLRLVDTNGISEPSSKRGVGPAQAEGRRIAPGGLPGDGVAIELRRVVSAGTPALERDVVGLVTGSWCPGGSHASRASGCLAVLRAGALG